jgi:hypothetical protein
MADYYVDITTSYEAEFNSTSMSISPQSETLVSGDRLIFRWTQHVGSSSGRPSSITVSSWSSGAWTQTGNVSVTYNGGLTTRTVKSSPSVSSDSLTLSATNVSNITFTANVSSGIDTTPDNFELGNPIVSGNPNSYYFADTIKVTGLGSGQSATASASGSARISKNNGQSFSISLSVQNNDRVTTRLRASATYGQQLNTTINIGGVQDTWYVRTKTDPSSGELIQFGRYSGDVKLSDIKIFFGGINNTLDDYRIGDYVPNLPENSSITSDPAVDLALTDFRGAATSLYWDISPDNRVDEINTTSAGTTTYYYEWTSNVDWLLGYGTGMTDACEYKYQFLSRKKNLNGNITNTTDITSTSGSDGTFSKSNYTLRIAVTVGGNVEVEYYGTIRFFARNPLYNSVITETDVDFRWLFYGP